MAMTSRVRYGLFALAALGLVASGYALYVHYQLLTDPAYSSFCDVNETVSCVQVFQSQYGSIGGVPVAAAGAIWSALVLLLTAWGGTERQTKQGSRAAGYVFVLATIGLASVFYLGYASFFVLGQACPVCMTMYVSVIGTFLLSAGAASPVAALWSGLGEDLRGLRQSVTAVALAAVWLVASLVLVLGFPREEVVSAAEAAQPAAPAQPAETLAPDQLAELHAWVDAQPREAAAMPSSEGQVLLLKFNDYQCPSCRQAWNLYQGIIAQYEAQYPNAFVYQSRDYPLDPECGAGGAHGAACEAAVAVRLAAERDLKTEMEVALFDRQSATMTRADVKAWADEVAGVDGDVFDARYDEVLSEVRADAQFGQTLGVTGTPTFFLNGIRLPGLRPVAFDAMIAYELQKAGVTD
jgi:uncharacterized membrane protein